MIKKIFLLSFLFSSSIFSFSSAAESELILSNTDNFEVKSSHFIQSDSGVISLARNSNIIVTYTDPIFTEKDEEPQLDLSILNSKEEEVFTLQSPKRLLSEEESYDFSSSPEFDTYYKKNKTFFESTNLANDVFTITIPLNFGSGEHVLRTKVTIDGEVKTLEYKFDVSKSPYLFTDSEILIEDGVVFYNAGYTSLLETEKSNKVFIKISDKNDTELFSKELLKTFYAEGSIVLDEEIEVLKNIKQDVTVSIEIFDDSGEIILTQTKSVSPTRASKNILLTIFLGCIALFLILILFLLKKYKMKIPSLVLVLCIAFLSGYISIVYAQSEYCTNKPEDFCQEDIKITHLCSLTETCSVDSVLKKMFSSGTPVVKAASPKAGYTSTDINICSSMNTAPATGQKFYVIADSVGSSWVKKRYSVFEFTKTANSGSAQTIVFDSGERKRNVSSAIYDGNCNVKVINEYKGATSDSRAVRIKIIETGIIDSTMCKSRVVNPDLFQSNGNLISTQSCISGEVRDTFIKGSIVVQPAQFNPIKSWNNHTVNICNFFGYQSGSIPTGKDFYVLTEQTSSWTYISFPIFQFKFGTPNTTYNPSLNNIDAKLYKYNGKKENMPSMTYDGGCNVTFRLYNRGKDTDQWSSGYKLIEVGLVENAVCKDPLLTAQSSYKVESNWLGQTNRAVETETKKIPGGKYENISPFFNNLSNCTSQYACQLSGEWIQSSTGDSCIDCNTDHTGGDVICINGQEYAYSCGLDGTWQTSPTGNSCGSGFSVQCNVNPSSVTIQSGSTSYTDGVTFSANTSNGTAQSLSWKDVSGIQKSTNSTYTLSSISSQGTRSFSVPMTIYATSTDGTSDRDTCSVLVTDENQTLPPGGSGGSAPTATFYFNPNIADSNNQMCSLYLTASNSSSCYLKNRLGTTISLPVPDAVGSLNVQGQNMDVGTYTLFCNPLDNTGAVQIGNSISCYSNPDIREN